MPIIPGIYQKKSNITIGTQQDICIVCTQDKDPLEARECVGHLNGQPIFKGRSVNGENICICKECLNKIWKDIQNAR